MIDVGIWKWDAFLAPASLITCVVSISLDAVWDDSARTPRDYTTSIHNSYSFSTTKTAARVGPFDDFGTAPAHAFNIATGRQQLGDPDDSTRLPHFRSRRAELDSDISWTHTATLTVVTTYTARPGYMGAVPANTTDTYPIVATITLTPSLYGDSASSTGAYMDWSYSLTGVVGPVGIGITTDFSRTSVIEVDPFTMKHSAVVDCGFTDTATDASAETLLDYDIISQSGTHAATITVS